MNKYLIKYIGISNYDKESKKCFRFLLNRMELVYDNYGEKKPKKTSKKDFLDMLNKKSLIECIKIYNDRLEYFKKKIKEEKELKVLISINLKDKKICMEIEN